MINKKVIIAVSILVVSVIIVIDILSENYNRQLIAREITAKEADRDIDNKPPVKIGITYSYNKNNPNLDGINFVNGVKLAVNNINERGGVLNNRKIELVFENDNFDMDQAKNIAEKFSRDTDIIAVISSSDSKSSVPVSITYQYSGVIFISTSSTNPLYTREAFKYIFRNIPDDKHMGKSISKLVDSLHYTNLIILHSEEEAPKTISDVFTQNWIPLSSKNHIFSTSFHTKDVSFHDVISKISPIVNKRVEYDAILLLGERDSVLKMISQLRNAGIYAPVITGNNLDTHELLDIGEAANNTIVPTYFSLDLIQQNTQDFINLYNKTNGALPAIDAAQGYDAIMLLENAISNSKSTVPSALSESLLYMTKHKSITGTYSLNHKGNVVHREIFFKRVVDGKFRFFDIK